MLIRLRSEAGFAEAMALLPANGRHGGFVIHRSEPRIEDHLNVVYVPNTAETGRAWGIFDEQGRLVPATGFYRGPTHKLVMQEPTTTLDLMSVRDEAPDDVYLYGGAMHVHYGHFLLSTLSRYWSISAHGRGTTKMLVNAGDDAAHWFAYPHISYAFGQLGLGPDDFVRFDRPTRIRRLIVPSPSFEEEHYAHTAFADLGHIIGAGPGNPSNTRNSTPVYISKTRLQSGVWRVLNEDAILDVLIKHGVDVVFPEQMSFPNQIGLYANRAIVCGAVGSGLHSSIFAQSPARIVAYNRDPVILTNYPLLDAINGVKAEYVCPAEGFTVVEGDSSFNLQCRFNEPVQLAEDLLRMMDRSRAEVSRVTTMPTRLADTDPSLDVIGLRHQTDKSSAHHNFLVFYERFFRDLREVPGLRLLEIGVYAGASIRTWEEYFPTASIVGADVNPDALQYASARTTIEIADQSNIADLIRLATTHGPFDILLDDGSHQWDHQITTFRTLYPFLKPGGYYVMEDIDTSYGSYVEGYRSPAMVPAAKYLHALCDYLVGDAALDRSQETDAFIRSYAPLTEFMAFYRRTCVIRRKPA